MRVFIITAGISCILLSLVMCGVALIAIIDPIGTKMADDNDPFGTPPSRLSSVSMLGGSAAIGAAGIHLLRRSLSSRSDVSNVA